MIHFESWHTISTYFLIVKYNRAGKLEEISHWQIWPGSGVCTEQVERSQNTVLCSDHCNIWDITYTTGGQPFSPTLSPQIGVHPFCALHKASSPSTSFSAGFEGLPSTSPILPPRGSIETDLATWRQLYRQSSLSTRSQLQQTFNRWFVADKLSNAGEASDSVGCLKGCC